MSDKLAKLKAKATTFQLQEALGAGLSRRDVYYYTQKGYIVRVAHGLYRFADETESSDPQSELKQLLLLCPQCVVGLHTALKLFDLTDEISAEIDLVAPTTNIPKRKLDGVKIHTAPPKLMKLGLTAVNGIAVTTIERTLVELLRKGEPLSTVLGVMRLAQKKGIGIELTQVKKLGDKFRVSKKVQTLLEAFL